MEQESNQEGATQEVTSEVTSTEEKETSGRTRTEKEFTGMQSQKDKADARAIKAEASVTSVQNELQELRNYNEQQRLEARRKEIVELADEPEEQAKVRRKHQLEDETRQLEKKNVELLGKVWKKYDQAMDLATQHNLSLNDARELMNAESPKHMEDLAQLKVEQAKGQGKVQKGTSGETKGFVPDSATSDASPTDFKQLEKNFIDDPYKYGKQYKEALAKRGQ